MLEYHWLFVVFLRSARHFTGAEGKGTLLPPISPPSSEIHHLFILDERLMMGNFEAIQRNKTLINAQMWVPLHGVYLVLHDVSPVIKNDRV